MGEYGPASQLAACMQIRTIGFRIKARTCVVCKALRTHGKAQHNPKSRVPNERDMKSMDVPVRQHANNGQLLLELAETIVILSQIYYFDCHIFALRRAPRAPDNRRRLLIDG